MSAGRSAASRQVTLEEVKKMSDEKLRFAIARACPDLFEVHETYASELPDGKFRKFLVRKGEGVTGDEIDPVHDLNAVHEVEKSLKALQKFDYSQHLESTLGLVHWQDSKAPPEIRHFAYAAASARQRCEALVLCLSPGSKNTNA